MRISCDSSRSLHVRAHGRVLGRVCALELQSNIYIYIYIYSDLGGLASGVLQAFSYIWARGVQPARVCGVPRPGLVCTFCLDPVSSCTDSTSERFGLARPCVYFLFGCCACFCTVCLETVIATSFLTVEITHQRCLIPWRTLTHRRSQ